MNKSTTKRKVKEFMKCLTDFIDKRVQAGIVSEGMPPEMKKSDYDDEEALAVQLFDLLEDR